MCGVSLMVKHLTWVMFHPTLYVFGIAQHTVEVVHFATTNQLFVQRSNYEPICQVIKKMHK